MKMCILILSVFITSVAIAAGSATFAVAQPVPSKNIHLYLVVNDKGNKPVTDLKPEDLFVTDNNEPVILSDLQLMNGKPEIQPKIMLLFNRPGFDPKDKSSISASQQMSKRLRDVAARLLKLIPDSGFEISVMDVFGRVQLQQDFTADRKAITDGVAAAVQPGDFGATVTPNTAEQKLDQSLQPSWTATLSAEQIAAGQAISAAIFESANYVNNQQLPSSLASLLALARAVGNMKGRKAIIYFSHSADLIGTGGDKAKAQDAIQSIIGAANWSGTNIYIVNLDDQSPGAATGQALDAYSNISAGSSNPGAITGATASGSATGANGNGFNQAKAGQFASASEFRYLASRNDSVPPIPGSLDALVRGTEGYAFSGDDSLAAPVKQLVSDLTTYYEATYASPRNGSDGKFHAVVVKPVRQGMKVRSQAGYLAPVTTAGPSEPSRR
jgi:VWFA-related protein